MKQLVIPAISVLFITLWSYILLKLGDDGCGLETVIPVIFYWMAMAASIVLGLIIGCIAAFTTILKVGKRE